MHLKKIVIFLFVLIFFSISIFSGCIFDNILPKETSFSLKSYYVTDEEGFPGLYIDFSSSGGRVTSKIYGPAGELKDSDYFYGDSSSILHISDYRDAVEPGTYKFYVYDNNGKNIFSKSITYDTASLSVISCNQRWWDNKGTSYLTGLELLIQNTGDIPVYPHQLKLESGSTIETYLPIPTVIKPGELDYVKCFTFLNESSLSNNLFVTIIDSVGNSIITEIYDIDIDINVETRYYTKGLEKTLEIPYPDFLFEYYSSLDRLESEDYSLYIFDNYDNFYISTIIDLLINNLNNGEIDYNSNNEIGKINFLANFVQSLEYMKDSPSNEKFEYPRYPVETLFNKLGGGDCEDKAILTACMLTHEGFNVSLIRLPNHMAVGVNISEEILAYDHYIKGYYFLETTTEGKPVGFIPMEYRDEIDITVYSLEKRPLLVHHWKNSYLTIYSQTESGNFVKLNAFIENLGSDTAYNINLEGVFITDAGIELNAKNIVISSIEPYQKMKKSLSINIPSGYITTFKSRIYLNNIIVDERESDSTFS